MTGRFCSCWWKSRFLCGKEAHWIVLMKQISCNHLSLQVENSTTWLSTLYLTEDSNDKLKSSKEWLCHKIKLRDWFLSRGFLRSEHRSCLPTRKQHEWCFLIDIHRKEHRLCVTTRKQNRSNTECPKPNSELGSRLISRSFSFKWHLHSEISRNFLSRVAKVNRIKKFLLQHPIFIARVGERTECKSRFRQRCWLTERKENRKICHGKKTDFQWTTSQELEKIGLQLTFTTNQTGRHFLLALGLHCQN